MDSRYIAVFLFYYLNRVYFDISYSSVLLSASPVFVMLIFIRILNIFLFIFLLVVKLKRALNCNQNSLCTLINKSLLLMRQPFSSFQLLYHYLIIQSKSFPIEESSKLKRFLLYIWFLRFNNRAL